MLKYKNWIRVVERHAVDRAGQRIGQAISCTGQIIRTTLMAGVVMAPLSGYAQKLDLFTLDGTNGFKIFGEVESGAFGNAVSPAGDINADGIDDMIVGAARTDIDGMAYVGAVYLIFGTEQGMSTPFDVAKLDGSNGFKINGDTVFGTFGERVSAAGDINDDGIDDVVIAMSMRDSDTVVGYVLYGRKSGFTTPIELSNLDGKYGFQLTIDPLSGGGSVDVSDAGDVNGDGIDDIIIANNGADPDGRFDAGVTFVVFGSRRNFPSPFLLSNLDGTNGFRIHGENIQDYSGGSVSGAGDVNGDGIDDIIIGASWADPNGTISGSSYVVFGTNQRLDLPFELSSLDGNNGFKLNGENAYDYFGAVVSNAGDINADGLDDVVIGARGSDFGGENSGAGYVVFGTDQGFQSTIEVSDLNGRTGFKLIGEMANSQYGSNVSSAGDVNGDGIDDVMFAARFIVEEGFTESRTATYIVFGRSKEFEPLPSHSEIDSSNGFRIVGEAELDFAGLDGSTVGDINYDGIDDLILGASRAENSGLNVGASYIVYGRRDWNLPEPPPDCGEPAIKPIYDHGLFVWQECPRGLPNGQWHFRATSGFDSVVKYTGVLQSDTPVTTTPYQFEASDVLQTTETSFAFVVRMLRSGIDGMNMSAIPGASLCFDVSIFSSIGASSIRLGNRRQELSAFPIDLGTGNTCKLTPPMDTCGVPELSGTSAAGLYVWRDCAYDRWRILNLSRGETLQAFRGRVRADTELGSVTALNFEPSDRLTVLSSSSVGFTMRTIMGGSDAIGFVADNAQSICLEIMQNTDDSPLFVGQSAVPKRLPDGSIDLFTGESCECVDCP